jgi:hypothetical protein
LKVPQEATPHALSDTRSRRPAQSRSQLPQGRKSALVEEALARYLNPERNRLLDDAVLRRLDGLTRNVGVMARDVAVATETLSLFVRYFLTITPPLPQADQDAARILGRQRFEVFVAQVGRRLGSNHRLVSEVLESIAAHNPDLSATARDDAPLKSTSSRHHARPASTHEATVMPSLDVARLCGGKMRPRFATASKPMFSAVKPNADAISPRPQ